MGSNNHKYHIWPFIVGTVLGLFLVLLIIEGLALYGESANSKLVFLKTADKWIALIGAILSYVGTCFIGIIAMWQNMKLNEVNERLLTIEESKVIPKLVCKANNIKHMDGGRVRLYFQIEHIGGDVALNVGIKDITISVSSVNGEFWDTAKSNRRSGDLCNGFQIYWVECEDIISELDDIEVEFCLSFSDILGTSYEMSQCVFWKGKKHPENGDYNSVPKERENNNARETASVR